MDIKVVRCPLCRRVLEKCKDGWDCVCGVRVLVPGGAGAGAGAGAGGQTTLLDYGVRI